MTAPELDVLVVGGGPVGLFLGCCLAATPLSFAVLERERQPRAGSRSIGIHPPALECARELGLDQDLILEGVAVRRGHAHDDLGHLGTVDFAGTPGPFPFVLVVPQDRTERLLTESLQRRHPEALVRGAEVVAVAEADEHVVVTVRRDGRTEELRARVAVGCGGKGCPVRRALGAELRGKALRGAFLMGDFADDSELGVEGHIFMTRDGLVESFPLPEQRRRWVVSDGDGRAEPDAERIATLVERRTGLAIDPGSATMISAFGIEQRLAERMAGGRLALAGDAAHVVSPFGGQGMNLGWLDAFELARALEGQRLAGTSLGQVLRLYDQRRRAAARSVLRRGALNTWLGRPVKRPRLRRALARSMLRAPFTGVAARVFTMRWL